MSEVDILKRRLHREIEARKQAENILENKALELYLTNEKLRELNSSQEQIIQQRTNELQRSKERYQALIESASDIIFEISVDGYFTYVSPVCKEITGLHPENLIGTYYLDLIHPKHSSEVQEFYLNAIEKGIEKSYLEFPILKADQSILWLGQQVQIDFSNPDNINITAIARDIHDLVMARVSLKASEEKYRGIIEGMELGLLEVDNDGKIRKVYPWFCDMTGYTENEIIGKSPVELLLKPEDVSLMEEQSKKRMRGQAGVYEIELRKKDGSFMWVAISGAPYYNLKGEVDGSIGAHLDITPQKELQKDLEKAKEDAEKARMAEKLFLAQMSHEIRTPLNAVLGMSNLLLLTDLNEEQNQYVLDLKVATDILHGLISDVLDLSKIESGELEVMLSEIRVERSLAMICNTLNYKAKEHGNTLTYFVDPAIPEKIRADKTIVNQILLNLIGNAIKFTKNGQIKVEVALKSQHDESLVLEFKVTDNGIGIAPEKIEYVFDRFKQVQSNLMVENIGAGLGLAICKSLVEIHGGEISATSTLNKETKFTFTLRVNIAEQANDDVAATSPRNPGVELENLYVLIAEDSEINAKYITALMNKWKIRYDLAENGLKAWGFAQKEKYDILLLDMQMPKLMGYEVAEKIRDDYANPNNKAPILALTAAGLFDEIQKSLAAGMNDYLTKPYTPDQLLSVIEKNTPRVSRKPRGAEVKEMYMASLILPKCINPVVLVDMYAGDAEYALHMAELYLKMLPKEQKVANQLLGDKKVEAIKSWLHKIAPSVKMMGLEELHAHCQRLEIEIIEKTRFKDVEDSFKVILKELEITKGAVKILVSKLK